MHLGGYIYVKFVYKLACLYTSSSMLNALKNTVTAILHCWLPIFALLAAMSVANLWQTSPFQYSKHKKEKLESVLWSVTCIDVIFIRASRAHWLQPVNASAAVPLSAHIASLVHAGTICHDSHQLDYARLIYKLLKFCKTKENVAAVRSEMYRGSAYSTVGGKVLHGESMASKIYTTHQAA